MTGIGKIDATVTGNQHELKATGTLVGDGVKYGDNGALTVSSTFTATVPELTVADANVVADTHATFVSIAGQEINELDAKTTYKQKQLDFDATAKQPQRSLGAAGSLLLHPDHQESSPPAARPDDPGADLAARARVAADDQLRARCGHGEPCHPRERRAADRRRRHVRPARRCIERDPHQRRSRQRRRDAAASAAADRHPQRLGHGERHDGGAGREGRISRSTRAASSSTATTRSAAR